MLIGMKCVVAFAAHRDQIKQKLMTNIVIMKVMSIYRIPLATAFAQSPGPFLD